MTRMRRVFRGRQFLRGRQSYTFVMLMLLVVTLLQSMTSYSVTFGELATLMPRLAHSPFEVGWFLVRWVAMVLVIVLWLFGGLRPLFYAIIAANTLLTAGLLVTTTTLVAVLFGFTAREVGELLRDVALLAGSNILVFSIWYWLIDPPGIDEDTPSAQRWDFLFPQRANPIPQYEQWQPRYTDYLFLAFTTTVAFSPTDTLPLTRRAKLLMMLQATISMVTLVVVVGTAVNVL